jgi:hypothetical protein
VLPFGRCPRVSGRHGHETPSRCELLPWRHTIKCDGSGSRRVMTPQQGRCSGHLRLVIVRTNGPGNLARRPNPFVIQSAIGPSSCFGRFRNNRPRASVAVRPLRPEAPRARRPRNSMGERASYRQAKKDRLPPSVRNDPGPEYACRVEDRDCGGKGRLAPVERWFDEPRHCRYGATLLFDR